MNNQNGFVAADSERSYEQIGAADLARLADIAARDRDDFVSRFPRYRNIELLCVALCQGAALHYIDGKNGIKDFDVWTFFKKTDQEPTFPWRRRVERDFGASKFGRHPDDMGLVGRRVDLLGRSIDSNGMTPTEALRKYLSEKQSHSAYRLSEKPVVLLQPGHLRGEVAWRERQS